MAHNELTRLVSECLNNPDRIVDFHFLSDSDLCMISPRVLEVMAYEKNVCLPRAEVWYKHYNLHPVDEEELPSSIEIPFEVIDKFRNEKDPKALKLFIHYRDKDRLDVYIKKD